MGAKKSSRYFIDEAGLSVGDVGAVDRGKEEPSELPAEENDLWVGFEEDDSGVDQAECSLLRSILRRDETEDREEAVSVEEVDAEEEGVEKPDRLSSDDCGS